MEKIDLTQYGFEKIGEKADTWTEYYNGEIRITIYDYFYEHSNKTASRIQTFVVNTKKTTSMAFPLAELENWLEKKGIMKIIK